MWLKPFSTAILSSSSTSTSSSSTSSSVSASTGPASSGAVSPRTPTTTNSSSSRGKGEIVEIREDGLTDLVQHRSNSTVIFSSDPTVVLSHCFISKENPNPKVTFSFQLPEELPPSYRGTILRYSYTLALGIKVLDEKIITTPATASASASASSAPTSTVYIMRIPIRVVSPLCSLCVLESPFVSLNFDFRWETSDKTAQLQIDKRYALDVSFYKSYNRKKQQISVEHGESDAVEMSTSPASSVSAAIPSSFDYIFASIGRLMAGNSNSKTFAILNVTEAEDVSNNGPIICYLSLSSQSLRIGDIVSGVLDFSHSTVQCVRVSVVLSLEESVRAALFKEHSHRRPTLKKSIAEFSEFVFNTTSTNFQLMIPPHATAQFQTDALRLRWFLDVEFSIVPTSQRAHIFKKKRAELKQQRQKNGPSLPSTSDSYSHPDFILSQDLVNCPLETLCWQVPLDVWPSPVVQPDCANQSCTIKTICA